MTQCECCPAQTDLVCCGSVDEPMLWFCLEDYVTHVVGAHGGVAQPGCLTIDEARQRWES